MFKRRLREMHHRLYRLRCYGRCVLLLHKGSSVNASIVAAAERSAVAGLTISTGRRRLAKALGKTAEVGEPRATHRRLKRFYKTPVRRAG